MKKSILIGLIILFGFKTQTKYKFEFTEQQIQMLWNAIDNSNAPHSEIKAIQKVIEEQYKAQLPKPPITDSSKIKR